MNKKTITDEVDVTLHARTRVIMAKRGLHWKDVLTEALTTWCAAEELRDRKANQKS